MVELLLVCATAHVLLGTLVTTFCLSPSLQGAGMHLQQPAPLHYHQVELMTQVNVQCQVGGVEQ